MIFELEHFLKEARVVIHNNIPPNNFVITDMILPNSSLKHKYYFEKLYYFSAF